MRKNLTILSPISSHRHRKNQASVEALINCGDYNVATIECFGMSEVSRARNETASRAYEHIKEVGGLVFWFDADMVIDSLDTFALHVACVEQSGRAISGRYVKRQDPTMLAAAKMVDSLEKVEHHKLNALDIKLEATMCGMGCLLMTAELFLKQIESVPVANTKEGPQFLMCCPRIEPHEEMGHIMISEDFDYCRSLDGGAWLAEITNGDSTSWLDYGHVGEQVLKHKPQRHLMADNT